jgi:hypothetical protein
MTKASAELALAMTVFGLRQGNSLLRGRPVTAELEEVARGLSGRFDPQESSLFNVPNEIQKTMIGMAFDLAQPANLTPQGFTRTAAGMIRSTLDMAARMVPGCKSCNGSSSWRGRGKA